MLAIELKRVAANENVSLAALSKRVKQCMVEEGFVLWRVTHVVQNKRLDQERVLEFIIYSNQQIQSFGIDPSRCIPNIDETKINFDLHGSFKLEKGGAKMVGMKTSDTPGRCTVLVGVTLCGKN